MKKINIKGVIPIKYRLGVQEDKEERLSEDSTENESTKNESTKNESTKNESTKNESTKNESTKNKLMSESQLIIPTLSNQARHELKAIHSLFEQRTNETTSKRTAYGIG
jgi:hypothetical protein